MNNTHILLTLLILISILVLIIVFLKQKYYDKFADVKASVVYLKAPTTNLTQTLEEKKTYSCNGTICKPKTIEPFVEIPLTEEMVNQILNDISNTISTIETNMNTIYNTLINYYNVNNENTDLLGNPYNPSTNQNNYINNFKTDYETNLNKINTIIESLDKYREDFTNLPTIDKNKKEISSYIVFN